MGIFSEAQIDWSPFLVCKKDEKAPYPRALGTPEGLADRLRFVAFAEKQAVNAFKTAAQVYSVPEVVKKIWLKLSTEEEKHLSWLLIRMNELNVSVNERPQSLALWYSFDHCKTPMQFANFMANAEERGRVAGEQFYETLLKVDLKTAELFKQIALEEQDHIKLAESVLKHLK